MTALAQTEKQDGMEDPMDFDTALREITEPIATARFRTGVPILLTVEDAAGRLGVGRTLMRALVAAHEVESVKIGRLRRIPEDALATYIERLRHPDASVQAV